VARVESLPAVSQVRVHRAWPRTLVIDVVERTGVAAVPLGDEYALIDAEGVVFHREPSPPLDLPVVRVDSPGPEDPATRAAVRVLAALTPRLRADLETLTVAGPANIELSLFSGWTVLWGDESASEDKARVATALLDHEGLPNPEATVIDVSAPEVVAVR
jgi:cell division protein FtsQ